MGAVVVQLFDQWVFKIVTAKSLFVHHGNSCLIIY